MTMKAWPIFCAATLIASCQPALVNLPPVHNCPPPAAPPKDECSKLEIPPHIPQTMLIDIDEKKQKADANGKAFLQRYVDLGEQIAKCKK